VRKVLRRTNSVEEECSRLIPILAGNGGRQYLEQVDRHDLMTMAIMLMHRLHSVEKETWAAINKQITHWTDSGDWETLAAHIERGGKLTGSMKRFLVQVLRQEVKKPKNRPKTYATSERHQRIAEFILTERRGGATKETAIMNAKQKFHLAYDTLEDIFDNNKKVAQERAQQKREMFTRVVRTWRAFRAVLEEMDRRGDFPIKPDSSLPCPFADLIGDPADYA
jgi:hypothetical protein